MKTWCFGINNDYLVELVLSGKKRATTSLYNENDIPVENEESILLFSDRRQACITKTSRVVITEFKNITWDLAKLEGENNSLDEWRKELDNFIVESDIKLDYFDEVVNHIIQNEKRILDFFKLEKLPNKVQIMILSYEPFKEFVVSKYGEIQDYVSGDSDSKTNTIRILNIADQIKYTTHKNASIERIKGTALHEIVHQCHHVFHNDYRGITWFAEGLATNISNQDYELKNLNECDFDKLRSDFRHYKGSYSFSYTLVNYILNNYTEEEIIRLYKEPDYLRERAERIFEEAIVWVKEQLICKK